MCINEKKCINKQVGGGILDCSESEKGYLGTCFVDACVLFNTKRECLFPNLWIKKRKTSISLLHGSDEVVFRW